tara:strand:+ start:4967 stop:6178 length:1212 start_codon:yes stop_codon:yes gene_type:complete
LKKGVLNIVFIVCFWAGFSQPYENGLNSFTHATKESCHCDSAILKSLKLKHLKKQKITVFEACELLCNQKQNHPYLEKLIAEKGLPLKFSFIPIVQNVVRVDKYNQVGLWGLNYIYALHNGLRMGKYVDQRKDPFAATIAATKQLEKFIAKYEDPNWTVLAFWTSPSYIQSVKKVAQSESWEECKPFIKSECLNQLHLLNDLYKIDSSKAIISSNKKSKTADLDSIYLNETISYNAIYDLTFLDLSNINKNNPALLKPYIPSNLKISVTKNEKEKLSSVLPELSNYQKSLDKVQLKSMKFKKKYEVKQGDNLGKIAIENEITVDEIMKWNNLKTTTIYIGEKLILFEEEDPSSSMNFEKYIVKKGDELWSIAQKFNGVTTKNILAYNYLTNIKKGEILKIPMK